MSSGGDPPGSYELFWDDQSRLIDMVVTKQPVITQAAAGLCLLRQLALLFIGLIAACEPTPKQPDYITANSISEPVDDDADDILLSLNGLLRLRTEANKKTIDPTIEYLSNLMCGRSDGLGAIDIDNFYPMDRIAWRWPTADCSF